MKEIDLKALMKALNLLCLAYEVKFVAGQAEQEGMLLIENDKEFFGYSVHLTEHNETYLEELKT